MNLFKCEQVARYVLSDGGMGTTAGFHGANAIGAERLVADKELSIFFGKNVIGNDGHIHAVAKLPAEGQHQGCFAASDRTTDTDGESTPRKVALVGQFAAMEMAGMIHVLVGMAARAVVMMCHNGKSKNPSAAA